MNYQTLVGNRTYDFVILIIMQFYCVCSVQTPVSCLSVCAVATALVVGFAAGGITYAISKPSDKLDGVSSQHLLLLLINPVVNLKNK